MLGTWVNKNLKDSNVDKKEQNLVRNWISNWLKTDTIVKVQQ